MFFSEMLSDLISLWVGQMTSPWSSEGTSVARTYCFLSSREDAEDGFEVGLHVPQEVQAVRLDLGERLLVGDDVPVLVLLGPKGADDPPADLGRTVVVEGLLVDVE